MTLHETSARDTRNQEPDAADLDAPLRRELDAFYDGPDVDERMRDAFDAAYAVGRRARP